MAKKSKKYDNGGGAIYVYGDDANVLNIAYGIESLMDYKNQIAKEEK